MAKYEFKIEADSVDITDAVIADFSIRNGRSTLSQGFVQWSANFQAYKKDLKSILATAGKNPDYVAPGTQITISVYDPDATAYVTMFRGYITNTSGTAYTYSYSCVDEAFWKLTAAEPQTVDWFVQLDGWVKSVAVDADNDVTFDSQITLTNPFPYYNPPDGTTSNVSEEINKVGQIAKQNMVILYPVDDRTLDGFGYLTLGTLEVQDYATDAFSITDGDIDLNYSISRDSSDIYNTVVVDYNGGTYTAEDVTSRNLLGQRRYEINSYFDYLSGVPAAPTAAVAARELGEALLQQYSQWGFCLIDFTTSADRLGLDVTDTVKETMPLKVIDASAVTAEEFQDRLVIQEVEHRCSPDYWQINFIAANYRFVTTPQTWDEVTATLTWDDVPDYLTWDMIKVMDL